MPRLRKEMFFHPTRAQFEPYLQAADKYAYRGIGTLAHALDWLNERRPFNFINFRPTNKVYDQLNQLEGNDLALHVKHEDDISRLEAQFTILLQLYGYSDLISSYLHGSSNPYRQALDYYCILFGSNYMTATITAGANEIETHVAKLIRRIRRHYSFDLEGTPDALARQQALLKAPEYFARSQLVPNLLYIMLAFQALGTKTIYDATSEGFVNPNDGLKYGVILNFAASIIDAMILYSMTKGLGIQQDVNTHNEIIEDTTDAADALDIDFLNNRAITAPGRRASKDSHSVLWIQSMVLTLATWLPLAAGLFLSGQKDQAGAAVGATVLAAVVSLINQMSGNFRDIVQAKFDERQFRKLLNYLLAEGESLKSKAAFDRHRAEFKLDDGYNTKLAATENAAMLSIAPFTIKAHKGRIITAEDILIFREGLNVVLGDEGAGKTLVVEKIAERIKAEELGESHVLTDHGYIGVHNDPDFPDKVVFMNAEAIRHLHLFPYILLNLDLIFSNPAKSGQTDQATNLLYQYFTGNPSLHRYELQAIELGIEVLYGVKTLNEAKREVRRNKKASQVFTLLMMHPYFLRIDNLKIALRNKLQTFSAEFLDKTGGSIPILNEEDIRTISGDTQFSDLDGKFRIISRFLLHMSQAGKLENFDDDKKRKIYIIEGLLDRFPPEELSQWVRFLEYFANETMSSIIITTRKDTIKDVVANAANYQSLITLDRNKNVTHVKQQLIPLGEKSKKTDVVANALDEPNTANLAPPA